MAKGDTTPPERAALSGRIKRAALALGTVAVLIGGALGIRSLTVNASNPAYAALSPDSVPAIIRSGQYLGPHNPSARLTIELSVTPNNAAELDAELASLYDPHSSNYQHWLSAHDYEARYGPTPAQRHQLDAFMQSYGLQPTHDDVSPFLARYAGTTAQVERAFRVQINDYRLKGQTGFANATVPQVPVNLLGLVRGIVGLDNLTRRHPLYRVRPRIAYVCPPPNAHWGGGPANNAGGSCDVGGGLTPKQIRGIYDLNPIYHSNNGGGQTIGVYELSNWSYADVKHYESQYGIPNVPFSFQNIDGGPTIDHSGAIEVELDVELQLAVAPGIKQLVVYDAPNDGNGPTDEYAAIAHADAVTALSTSWGICESLTTPGQRYAEMNAFMQMAAQGQSVFAAAGDTGAYDCLGQGIPQANWPEVDDPAGNPYVTAVGGTSFFADGFNPGNSTTPTYPAGKEYVWNDFNNCSTQPFPINGTEQYCYFGAGGGGPSRLWEMPSWQYGHGVISSYTQSGRYCSPTGTYRCREVPDVSIDADALTGYSIYCTDPLDEGICTGTPGWNMIGGTSAGAPLWAAMAALAADYHHRRLGLFSPQLYSMFRLPDAYTKYYHDMIRSTTESYTPPGSSTTETATVSTNGYFPQTWNYDMATGIGTPDFSNVAIGM